MHLAKGAILCAFVAVSVHHTASPATGDNSETALHLGDCQSHLREVVSQIQENATKKGDAVLAEWSVDGSVILRFDHFYQRMRCRNGTLSVDYPGFNP